MKDYALHRLRARRQTGSRNAVETAIDLSKRDRSSSWTRVTRDRIAPWAANEDRPDDETGRQRGCGDGTEETGKEAADTITEGRAAVAVPSVLRRGTR